jgi:hypothetical protein
VTIALWLADTLGALREVVLPVYEKIAQAIANASGSE